MTSGQGIFLHTDCVPFWDAAPFHWDAAPPDFQSLGPKRKTCRAMSCLISLYYVSPTTVSSPFFCPVVRSTLPSALSRSRSRLSPCPTVRCALYCLIDCPLHIPALFYPVLPCPAVPLPLTCPALPCPALPWPCPYPGQPLPLPLFLSYKCPCPVPVPVPVPAPPCPVLPYFESAHAPAPATATARVPDTTLPALR